MTPRDVSALMRQATAKIALMVGRAVLRLADDTSELQRIQLEALPGEVRDQVERLQQYGFTSVPLNGADVIILAIGGRRQHPIAIAVDDRRNRKRNMVSGEVAIYTDEGDYVHLKRGRIVEINTATLVVKASTKVRFETPLIETTGSINVINSGGVTNAVTITGSLTATVDVKAGGAAISLVGHRHGGVQAGGSQTGVPV